MTRMRGGLMALDVNSRSTGVAFGDGPDAPAPRCLTWKMPGAEDLPRACGQLGTSVSEICKLIHPDIVVIEAPLVLIDRLHGARVALVLMSLYGAAASAAHNSGGRVVDGHIATWRKHFLGRGNLAGAEAKRLTMTRCEQLGWKVTNTDEADAAGLWAWGMAVNYKHWRPGVGTALFSGAAA